MQQCTGGAPSQGFLSVPRWRATFCEGAREKADTNGEERRQEQTGRGWKAEEVVERPRGARHWAPPLGARARVPA
eukprot:9485921-Pyramimonas_sp.AAC.1